MLKNKWLRYGGIALAVVVLLAGGILFAYKQGLANYMKTGGLILEYHGIGYEAWDRTLIMKPETFERHIKYMHKEGYHMVTVAELAKRLREGKSVDKYVAISFDDGYKNNYTQALPILNKYNAKATFHIVNRMIGKDIYMNIEELKQLRAAGMEIGSHTFSHNPLGDIDAKYLEWELGVSKYDLERRLGMKAEIETLAYPNGSYNPQIIQKLKEYGYKQALTGHTGMITKAYLEEKPMELYRVIIEDNGTGPFTFEGLLKRAYRIAYLRTWGIDLGD